MTVRQHLVRAVLPLATPADDGPFWSRFDRTAPTPLRGLVWGAAAAWWVLAWVSTRRPPARLGPDERERALARLVALPGGRALAPALRLVACLALLDSPEPP